MVGGGIVHMTAMGHCGLLFILLDISYSTALTEFLLDWQGF